MVTNEDLRAAFAERLKKAILDSGRPLRGAPVRMHEVTGLSANATTKWLKGESLPTQANLQALCRWLNVSEEWLLLGKGVDGSDRYSTADKPQTEGVAEQARDLARIASPRSASALQLIEQAAIEGRLSESDLVLLEQIAVRLAQRSANDTTTNETPYAGLKQKLREKDR